MCISKLEFPILWKVACTNHILKVAKSQANDDFRSFSIFSVLKVVYETLSLREMVDFLTDAAALQPNLKA